MMPVGPLFAGVDAGGTRCRVRVSDAAGHVLGAGAAGAANIRLGIDTSWAAIQAAIAQALKAAGLDLSAASLLHVGLGVAGIMDPQDVGRMAAAAPTLGGLTIDSDAHIACLGAFGGGDGAILILGTGSAGYLYQGARGRQIGGWGFELSDDGSGAQLGRAAIRAAVAAYDGLAPETAVTRALRAQFGDHPRDIVRWVDRARPADYGAIVPLVVAHADAGDPVAQALMADAAALIDGFIGRLAALGAGRVALMGGLAPIMTPRLAPASRTILTAPMGDAIDGALRMARRQVNS